MRRGPYLFDEFFASGKEETISPFLKKEARRFAHNLGLKGALIAAAFLLLSFVFSFFNDSLSSLFLLPVYFFVGIPSLIAAVQDIKSLEINIDVLMTLAAFLSFLLGSGLEGGLLLVLFELSYALEETVTKKTKGALSDLHHLAPKTACLLDENRRIVEKSIKEIEVGSHLLVRAGEVVPLDGKVVEGSSFVSRVHLTGEGAATPKTVGDLVEAGSQNLDGSLVIATIRKSSDSTLARIIQLITKAQEAKPKLERLFDRFSKVYAMTIIGLFFFFALCLPFFTSLPYLGIEGAIYRSLAFLIAASPCALIIATPTAYLSAISSCAKKGIILKGGTILDSLSTTSIIAFDKTGTITTGDLACEEILPLTPSSLSVENAVAIAAALEERAVHPIASAITSLAKTKGITSAPLLSFRAVPGFGLEGSITLAGETLPIAIGRAEFIENYHPGAAEKLTPLLAKHHSYTLLAVGPHLFAFFFTDELKANIPALFARLKAKALRLIMLTGDHKANADAVAAKVGITEAYSELRPEDKLAKVIELTSHGLIMIGDGVNDAPALARSTVGISMGKIGSATAVEASDVVFLQDDLSHLDWLLDKSDKTTQIVKQNLIIALSVILLATTPALLGLIPLWLAVVLHEGGTLVVGLNSLRLL